jgi:translation elongation factor EF-1beta
MLKAKVAAARAGKPEKEKPKQRSLIKLEIKPNEVETDLNAMALRIKQEIQHPGIQNWGDQHKLEPVAYGIFKLLINVVVFDDDIMVEDIEEMLMEKFPEDIQSIDVAAMSKV